MYMMNFTKINLLPGMIVEYRNGQRAMVVKVMYNNSEHMMLLGQSGYNNIDDYNTNLTAMNFTGEQSGYDIMKVYDTNGCYGRGFDIINNVNDMNIDTIWTRPKRIITKREIAQKFNIEIEDFEIL